MTTPIERAAEVIAQVQNVPFVGTKQRRIAEALAAAGLIATEVETRHHHKFGAYGPAQTRHVTPWKDAP